eukprot:2283888-Prymnesium_polylepis.1
MADADDPPEKWAQRPDVQQMLGNMLADPSGDHAAAAAEYLEGDLLDAHVASITRALRFLREDAAFTNSFTGDSGVALHTILYHLLGGADRDLPPPPADSKREATQRCAPGLRAAKKMSEKLDEDIIQARHAEKGGDASTM